MGCIGFGIAERNDGSIIGNNDMELKITKEEMSQKKLMVCTPMYGGLCHGAYMQSMLQLQGVCQQYGVRLTVSTILNESLVQRSRTYLTDGFMQSDCTHLLFVDADIGFNAQDVIFMLALQTPGSKYDIIAGPYAKKCLHRSSKILTEDGYIPIAKIVRDKFSGMVRTIDKDGNASWNKVTNWWAEKNTQRKRWVSLKTSTVRPRAVLTVTDDHEIAYVDNVFDPHIKYCRADEMIGRYMVVNPEHKSKNRWYNALWNKEQVSAAIGTILGDGCVGGGVLAEGHGKNQIPYCDHKARLLGAVPRGQTFSYVNAQTKELFELIGVGKDRKTIKNEPATRQRPPALRAIRARALALIGPGLLRNLRSANNRLAARQFAVAASNSRAGLGPASCPCGGGSSVAMSFSPVPSKRTRNSKSSTCSRLTSKVCSSLMSRLQRSGPEWVAARRARASTAARAATHGGYLFELPPVDRIAGAREQCEQFGRTQLDRDPKAGTLRTDVGHRHRVDIQECTVDRIEIRFHATGLDVEFHDCLTASIRGYCRRRRLEPVDHRQMSGGCRRRRSWQSTWVRAY